MDQVYDQLAKASLGRTAASRDDCRLDDIERGKYHFNIWFCKGGVVETISV